MERRGVPSHHLGSVRLVLVEYLVQYRLLLEAVDVVRRLRHHQQVLLVAHEPAVGGLGHLVLVLRAAVMYLLQEVVLLLTHHQLPCLFLALLELVLEGLGVDAHPTI